MYLLIILASSSVKTVPTLFPMIQFRTVGLLVNSLLTQLLLLSISVLICLFLLSLSKHKVIQRISGIVLVLWLTVTPLMPGVI